MAAMNQRDRRRVEQLRGDRADVAAAAAWAQAQTDGDLAALSDPRVAAACGSLLGFLAENLDIIPDDIRRHTGRIARELIGQPMDRPTVRRTRLS